MAINPKIHTYEEFCLAVENKSVLQNNQTFYIPKGNLAARMVSKEFSKLSLMDKIKDFVLTKIFPCFSKKYIEEKKEISRYLTEFGALYLKKEQFSDTNRSLIIENRKIRKEAKKEAKAARVQKAHDKALNQFKSPAADITLNQMHYYVAASTAARCEGVDHAQRMLKKKEHKALKKEAKAARVQNAQDKASIDPRIAIEDKITLLNNKILTYQEMIHKLDVSKQTTLAHPEGFEPDQIQNITHDLDRRMHNIQKDIHRAQRKLNDANLQLNALIANN